jgi:hypothetical protein
MRTDHAIARLTAAVGMFAGAKDRATGQPFTPSAFMPFMDEAPISLEDAMRTWKD